MRILDHHEGRVPGPGLYRMSAEAYHADPCPEPSLSSSIAKLLIDRSPEHAFLAHPRLGGPQEESNPTRPKEIGTAAHKLLLGHGTEVVPVDATAWTTKEAKAARKAAYAAGACPILRPDFAKAEDIADQALARLAKVPGCEGFRGAPAEVVAIARDRSGAWLRIMMDKVEIGERGAVIWDVKTGDTSAAPHGLGRRIAGMQMDVQAALYEHVLGVLLPHLRGRITFRWLFIENDAPHATTVADAPESMMHNGRRKVVLALRRWNAGLRSGAWPGYPATIAQPEMPGFADHQWAAMEAAASTAASNDGEVLDWNLATSPWRPLDMENAA